MVMSWDHGMVTSRVHAMVMSWDHGKKTERFLGKAKESRGNMEDYSEKV
jgi:hypothetical protein